ncbi:MAG: hypothetical protein KC776_04870, partial [Myxococcales bacterium]|nr:hypothetical protein [Myxococcales bacterium]
RRHLRVVELSVERATDAADVLRALSAVDEVAHYGHLLRVAVKGTTDPEALVRRALADSEISLEEIRPARVTVEDAFVSMVRHEQDGVRSAA